MVHRAAVSEVFLTGATRCDDMHFQCTAQLPRAHSYFSDHQSGLHTPCSAATLAVTGQGSIPHS
ncbi:AfsA-related hotdog domain-containing protein [Variovorax humicola]|uniref:AfsA-related hotdog domain-containing protein n=1 Tax=Variovorax humicola TaxID=1769758 RepID=UPI003BF50879